MTSFPGLLPSFPGNEVVKSKHLFRCVFTMLSNNPIGCTIFSVYMFICLHLPFCIKIFHCCYISDMPIDVHNDLFLSASLIGEAMQSMVTTVSRKTGNEQLFKRRAKQLTLCIMTQHARKAVWEFLSRSNPRWRLVVLVVGEMVKVPSKSSNKSPEPLLDGPAASEHMSPLLPFIFPAFGKYDTILDSFVTTTPAMHV